MKEHLTETIDKHDEKMLANYIQLLKIFFKTNKSCDLQILSPNTFFDNVVKILFKLNENSFESLIVGLEIYSEIIDKYIKPTLKEMVFINEILQYATFKLKLLYTSKTFYDDSLFNYCLKLKDRSSELISRYLSYKYLKLSNTGLKFISLQLLFETNCFF